ncbi:hypothetical protein C8R44DRAFT_885328 [Mycena epipterygia]|nr:hypothetical protein C8R44DRAFT_885328 [Mycena epipterygia]
MDQHFKLLRTDEEIRRLNMEIHCLVTYMMDEEVFLSHEEKCLCGEGKEEISHQVGFVQMECGQFTTLHMSRLVKLSKERGFTGDILPGFSICREHHTPVARDRHTEMCMPSPLPLSEDDGTVPHAEDEEEDEGSDDEDGSLTAAFMSIVRISGDDAVDAKDT